MRDMIQRPDTGNTPPRNPAPAADAPKGIDIRKYFYIITKRLWLLLLCFMTAIVVMLVMMARQIPEYQTTAKLHLRRSVGIPANLQQQDMQAILGDYAQTQRNIIIGRDVIGRARARLGLTPDEFAKRYRSLSVQPVWQTAIMSISVTGLEPAFCADYANAIAEAYVEYKAEELSGTSQNTVVVLSEQANRLAEEIARLENDVLLFVRENSVVGIRERGNVAATLLANLSKQAAEYRTQRMLLEAQQPLLAQATDEVVLATLEYGLTAASVASLMQDEMDGEVVEDSGAERLMDHGVVARPQWNDLKRENAVLEARLLSYRKKYKDAHPLIQETLRRLQQNEEAIKVEIQFSLKQYYSQLEALNIKEKAAARVEQQWEEQALEIDRKQKEYENLQRNLSRLQRLYDLIFNRLQEVDISAEIQQESVRIFERALVPGGPIKPRNLQSLFLAAMIGLGIGVGLVFLLEFMDDSIRHPEEIDHMLGLACLGLVPRAFWKQDGDDAYWIGKLDPSSGFAEAYRNIRSSLLLRPDGQSFRTLTITSSVPKEGKTTTSANLATCFAQAGQRVLLVDVDLRRGTVHHFFGLHAGSGMTEILQGQATMDQVVQPTGVPGLDFIGTGLFVDNPAEMILRPAMKEFLELAASQYDWVILDAPPVLAVSESTVIASLTDAVLLTIWSGRTSRKLVQAAIHQLRTRGANLIGAILNNLDLTRLGNYGSYGYYHFYDYDYRYEEENPSDGSGA
ncbi:MAG: polysaccharide biosynthesis tyrosine autokinase [Lentisphaerae bacterium]|jgi:capsular exopolysaccharide synthesis family protein|nr:polysaccharide biosynthesis tyrosine autokinase [Lentisphaerota bacterium]